MSQMENTDIEVNNLDDSRSIASTITTPSTGGTAESSMSIERRRMKLVAKYGTGKGTKFEEGTLRSLNRVVRAIIVPRMKFIATSKHFGSFEQPDFADETCWVHKIFEQMGSLKNASINRKAEIWMTYRNGISKQFSLHRSSVTSGLKTILIKGKSFEYARTSIKNLPHILLLHTLLITVYELRIERYTRASYDN